MNVELHSYTGFSEYTTYSPNITCTVGEPDFENPNSYQTIIKVIQKIGVRAGVTQYGGKERNAMDCPII